MKRKVSIETLGCRYNRLESAEIAWELEQEGYAPAAQGETPDVVVINTCTVTNKTDARCRTAIRKAKAANPQALVVVAGCYSETNPGEVANVEGADIVVGNADKHEIAKALRRVNGASEPQVYTGSVTPDVMPVRPITEMEGRTNAYLNVQTGCDETCSFCIVRIARGPSRSAEPDEVVAQVARLAENEIKEVALSGINLGEYNSDIDLAGLIERLLDETDMPRIRLSSINPNNVNDKLIDIIANSERVCRFLHIPLQSGSDAVLQRMQRPYTADMYGSLLQKLNKRIPDIGIGADVMVAFPGETEAEFMETYRLIERAPLMNLHLFGYSPREGTAAFDMPDKVSKKDRKARSTMLQALSENKNRDMRERHIGQRLNVLIESSRSVEGALKGFTDNYLQVELDGPDTIKNQIVRVKIVGNGAKRLIGQVE